MSIRAGAAAAISVIVAHALKLEFPLYALVAAIIVTDLSASRTRHLGLQRLIGTIIGAVLGASLGALSPLAHAGPLLVAVGVFAAMLATHVLGVRDAAKLAGFVSGIVLLDHNDRPWRYALYRLVETLIGFAAAFAISLIPKLLKVPELKEEPLRQRQIPKKDFVRRP